MSGHAFARVSGFGWTLVPFTPCWYEQAGGETPALRLEYRAAGGDRRAVVRFGGAEPDVKLAPGVKSLEEVATLSQGEARDRWWIETGPFAVPWPAEYAFASSGDGGVPVFDLVGPGGSLIYVQGPFPAEKRPENLVDLVGPGQSLRAQGTAGESEWVEVEYVHKGVPWRQRHYLLSPWPTGHFVGITAQAREEHADLMARSADEVATGFTVL